MESFDDPADQQDRECVWALINALLAIVGVFTNKYGFLLIKRSLVKTPTAAQENFYTSHSILNTLEAFGEEFEVSGDELVSKKDYSAGNNCQSTGIFHQLTEQKDPLTGQKDWPISKIW
ncbi:MAG: hypothetical protein KI791_06180 [Cyclobacteriaceae bacterium]|nr:hypothetical protein [Cyclobacteriaceae bacterium SS2]